MDWESLASEIAALLELSARNIHASRLGGGDINQAYCLQLDQRRFFVKLNRADRLSMFAAERAGLEALAATQSIRVPRVYATGSLSGFAYIAMEFIELGGRADAARLARALADLHGHCHWQFGFECDNTIGSTPQVNRFRDDWIEFWREQRLGFQLNLAADNGFDSRMVDAGYRLAADLDPLFGDYRPRASLLHGDLWSGNQGADSEGNPVIYDPACYYGDHETDLAMMELFGSPGAEFFAVYAQIFPVDAGYARRRELYNLYHVLNHANLFGGGYANRAQRMIDALLAELK
jgi:fructosamine-3-kinase